MPQLFERVLQRERGATLIEMLVAIGLTVLVGSIVASFFLHTQSRTANASARQVAQAEVNQIVTFLTRDMPMVQGASGVTAAGPSLDLQTTMGALSYHSACMTAPASIGDLNFSSAMAATTNCLSAGCPPGTVPGLTITRPSGQATRTFPQTLVAHAASTQATVGTMACFDTTATSLGIDVTSFYLNDARQVQQIHRHLNVPIGSTSGVTLLQAP